MSRLIDADAIQYTHAIARSIEDGHNWNELCVTKDDIDAAPTVPAIPVEWIEWRIAHAEREGFGAVVSMLRTVRDWWNDQRDVWEKEREADGT